MGLATREAFGEELAKLIVENANKKQFEGKDQVRALEDF